MNIIFRCAPALIDLLPHPVAARDVLPAWLRHMAPRAVSAVHGRSIRTLKQCPPFVDAMAHGFMVLLPCDVQVHDGRFDWDWRLPALSLSNHPRAPLSFHVPEQLVGSPLARGTHSVIKFNSFWTIELQAGWSLMAVHPVNRDDLPFRTITGLVEADSFFDVGINFPAVWTNATFNGTLPRGTPIAQCFAVPRTTPTLVCEAMDAQRVKRYEALANEIMAGPGVYRKQRRLSRGAG